MKKKILVIITGSIAAYKACSVLSKLKQKDYDLEVVLSKSALEFLGPSSIEGLTGKKPHTSMYEPGEVMDHIHLARWADLILVAPATAHFINSAAAGMGDSFPTTLFLAHDFKKPFLVAPAMNTMMYQHPATQASIAKLKSFGIEILETASGVLACGETGWGRLLEPDLLVAEVEKHFGKGISQKSQLPSKGEILITAGGTSEPLDSVRAITNFSTGKTGSKLAQFLAESGYQTHLLLSENHRVDLKSLESLANLDIHFFKTTEDLRRLIKNHLENPKIFAAIHAAAVSDYQITEITQVDGSLPTLTGGKTDSGQELIVKLKPQSKIINSIKSMSTNKNLFLVGFKLTDHASNEERNLKVASLFEKGLCDYVVHNDTKEISEHSHSFTVFGKGLNTVGVCRNTMELGAQILSILEEGKNL